MIRITVQRGDGVLVGEDIIEPLAGDENVLLNRGRNAIDEAALKRDVQLEVVYRSNFLPGQLVEVDDTLEGTTWRGKITRIEHRYQKAKTTTALAVERFL